MKKVFTRIFSVVVLLLMIGAAMPANAQYTKNDLANQTGVTAMCKDAAGNVYVLRYNGTYGDYDTGNAEVVEYPITGGSTTLNSNVGLDQGADGVVYESGYGIAIDGSGNIYITSFYDGEGNYGKILKLPAGNYSGAPITIYTGTSSKYAYFSGLAIDSHNNLYFTTYDWTTDGDDLLEIPNVAPLSSAFTGNPTPVSTHIGDAEAAVYAANANAPVSYVPYTAIAIDGSDNIFVAAGYAYSTVTAQEGTDGGKLFKFTATGNGTYDGGTVLKTNMYCSSLGIDPSGNLYGTVLVNGATDLNDAELVNYGNSTTGTNTGTSLATGTVVYSPLGQGIRILSWGIAAVSNKNIYVANGEVYNSGIEGDIYQLTTTATPASGVSFTGTNQNSTAISWTAGNGSNRAVFINQTASTSSFPAINDATNYTASTTYGSGTTAGTGWYCVYNGTGTSVSVSNLSASLPYRVAVVEYSGTVAAGTQIFLLATTGAVYTGASNNPNTVTTATPTITLSGSPAVLSTTAGTASSSTSFTVSGSNLNSGNLTISAPTGFEVSSSSSSGFGASYTIPETGTLGATNVFVRLAAADGVNSYTGNVGVSGGGATSQNQAVSGTVTNPSTTISSLTASSTLTNAGSVTYTATFAASVSGVNNSDFLVINTGLTGAFVSNVTGSGTTWTITVSTGSGDGSFQLEMNGSSGVTPSVSNATAVSPFGGTIVSVDKTSPTVAIGSPNIAYANSSTPVSWQITWSDANLKTSSINPGGLLTNVNTTGTVTVGTSINLTPGSGGNPTTAQFVGLTGDGTIGFTVPAGSAQDNAGNSASASSPSPTVIVDNTPPTIAISAPTVSSTVNGPVIYDVTYADANFNSNTLSSSDISLNRTGTANASSIMLLAGSGTIRTIILSGITGDGTLGISIGASTATDLAGNPAPASSASTTFSVDNTPPTVLSISRTDPNPIKDNVLDYQVTFSEPVTGVDLTDFTMVNSGVTTGAISVTGVSSSVYNVSIINVNGTGTAQLTLNGSGTGIADLSGNAIAAGFAGDTYNVDQTAPVANSLVYKSSNTNQLFAATGDVVSLSFTASETINAPTVSIAGHSIAATNTSGNDWVASYQMTGGDTEGRIPFSLSFTDLAGNPQPGVPYSDVTAGDDVEFDMTAPTISIGAPSVAQIGSGGTGTVSYTVTYADANFNTISLSPSDITLNTNATTATGTVGVSNSGTTSTVTISNITGAGTLGISIGANTASDQAGNMAPASNPSATFNVLSNQSALSGLAISTGTLSPAFNGSNTGNYTATVPWIISGIMFTPSASDVNATIDVAGNTVASGSQSPSVPLALGANTIHITVTAQDGVTKTIYTVIVTRANSNNANLARIQLTPGLALTETSSTSTTVNYTASAKSSISSVTLTPLTGNAGATVTVNGNPVTSGTASQSIPLAVGQTTITTVVTAQNGKIVKTYTVVVTRAPSDNANLATIKVNPPLKLSKTSETATEADYTASARNAFSTVTITPTTIDAGATVTVNGDPVTSGATSNDIALAVGQTTVTTVVTAQDGITKKTYIVTVTRAPSDNANMGSLLLSPQLVLTQTAATDGEVDYTASAKSTLGSVTLTPIPWDPTATVTVNGKNVTPGTPSDDITLVTGPNIITAVVTAGDGTTQKTYIITLTKAAASLNTAYQPISVSNPTDRPQMMGEEITVHQGISPNGDGINDFLIIDNIASHPNNKLQIMNRSGQLIYEAVGYDNSTNVFDGHSNKNGQMQLPGTYFYSLDYTDNGETKHKTGFIVLKY